MMKLKNGKGLTFSSPSRGSYISTKNGRTENGRTESSRPLPGVLISLQNFAKKCKKGVCSRPLPGVLISLHYDKIKKWKEINSSRPLPGVLISLPCPRNPLNYIRIFLLLRRKCNSIPYTDLIPHKIQDNVLFSTMRGKTGRYWEQ